MAQNVSSTDPIDGFKSWALKLGCPVNALPSDAALNRFIKSNHANVNKLMGQNQSKCDVKLFRNNFLLQSLSKSNLLSERHQSDLPNDFKNLKKVEKLNRQIGELKPRIQRLSSDVKAKNSALLEKADQLKEVKRHCRNIQNKCIQLKQKHCQLIEKIEEEKRFEALLADGMPVQVTAGTNEKIAAEKAIKKSLEILRTAYVEIGDRNFTKAHQSKVERDTRKAMAGITIVQLFEAVKCYSNNEMNAVNDKFNAIKVHPSNGSGSSAFDVAITKSLMKFYIDNLTTKKMKDEHGGRVDQYVQLYDQYQANIVDAMKTFNEPDVELFVDSICGDYLKQYGTFMSNQAVLQFHQQKLSNLQQLATERDNLLKGNELLATELSDMYAEIEKTYNSALDDIVSLGDVNKNMKQLQELSKYTINSFGNRSICNTSNSLLNCTLGPTVPSITINLAPAEYLKELVKLVDVAYEKWNQVPLQLSMDIEYVPTDEMFSQFYSLLTPNSALKDLKSKWKWYKAIDVLTQSLDVDKAVPQFTDTELLSFNLAKETTKMMKLMEDIKFMYETGSKTVTEIRKYLAFLLDTSLGSFIPDSVMINRRNFRDYEEEFLCACSLISNSMKKN